MTGNPKEERGPRGNGHIRPRPPGQKAIWELRYSRGVAGGKSLMTSVTFRGTKSQAKEELHKRLAAVAKGVHVDPSRVTVAEYIEQWLAGKKIDQKKITPKTWERYAELLRRHVSGSIGKIAIQKLDRNHLNGLYTQLLTDGRDDGRGLAPQTVRHVHRVLFSVLKEAAASHVLQQNPAAAASSPSVSTREVEILGPADLKALMSKLAGRPIFPLVATALGTGMRRGELLALRWSDVDLATGEIQVRHALEQTKAGIRLKEPKTKHGYRKIALPAFLVAEMRRLWKHQQEQRLALGLGKAPELSPVFGTVTGDFRRPDSLTKEWAGAAKSIGIKVTFHALRHTHASQLIASGLDVLTISRRLGHGNPTVTLNVYSHLFRHDQEPVVRALDAAFSFAQTENLSRLDK